MKLLVSWEIHRDQRHEVFKAFAEMDLADYQVSGGPDIKVLGRWHDLINGRGYGFYETTDKTALTAWVMKWNAAVDFQIDVVHDDEEAHSIVRSHFAG